MVTDLGCWGRVDVTHNAVPIGVLGCQHLLRVGAVYAGERQVVCVEGFIKDLQ